MRRRHREEKGSRTALRLAVEQWPDEYRFDFEEQAAIKEMLDNQPREQAEREAYEEVGARYARHARRH